MKKTIQIMILMLFPIVFINAQKTQLKSYVDLMTALKNGEVVSAVIHYGQTKLIIDEKEEDAPDAIGGMKLDTWEHFAEGTVRNEKAYVTSSESVLIGHGYYGYVYNYAKIRIYDDNSVEIIARYLDPKTFEVKMDETFKSSINNNDDGAVYLFK